MALRRTPLGMIAFLLPLLAAGSASAADPLAKKAVDAALNAAYAGYVHLTDGKNAEYIPALAKVDPNIYGIVLVTTDGKVYSAGDVTSEVSMQSISKVFTMAKVIEESGPQSLVDNIGVDATGQAFNSIVAIEQHKGAEMNPLVNAGAITTTSMVKGAGYDEIWNSILSYYGEFAGRSLSVSREVYESEAATNQRNQAIAELMFAYGHIKSDPAQALRADHVTQVLAVMATAGLYDESGKWLYTTGLPAKSGVGGGIIAVSPGKFGIAVISPPLDAAGNSVRAQKAIADISNALGGNPYAVVPHPASAQ